MAKSASKDPAVACLELVGLKAGWTLDKSIELLAQLDAAVGWKAASTHPLQPLETEYQGIVRNATRDIRDIELRKQVESELLGRFFFLNAAPPRLLGVREGEPYQGMALPLPQDRLREARVQLLAAKRMIAAGGEIDGGALRAHVQQAWAYANSVRGDFLTLPDSANWPVPPIQKAGLALNGLPPDLPTLIHSTTDLKVMTAICSLIGKAVSQLDKAVAGLASVQMLYMIESFYLFRLLIRYRVRSNQPLTPDAINEASSTLTGLVTNGHPWLANWLSAKIVDLGNRVTGIDPDNVLFFLKGGRAQQCLYGPATQGQNDWDSQIVINPNLPPRDWYELFRRVSNEVLLALGEYKREFYMLLHLYAGSFKQELPGTVEPMDIDDPDGPTIVDWMDVEDWDDPMGLDPTPSPKLEANCKAELIDVGLPRYDTAEAREQWAHLRGRIDRREGVPYPWPLYFVDEYLLMIREVMSGLSPAIRKAPKRVERLHDILGLDATREVVQLQYQSIPPSLHGARAAIGTLLNRDAEYALFVLLRQFAAGYGVNKDPGFAGAFNAWFAGEVGRIRDYGRYPPDLRTRITELGQARTWTDDIANLILAIGFAEYASEAMEAHFRARALFMESQRAVLAGFIRNLYRNSIFSPEEELEVQMALRGSYGAREQALYADFPQIGELDPVTYVSIGLYSPVEGASPSAILDLVQNAVDQSLPPSLAAIRDDAAGAIRIYWKAAQAIPPLAPYAPLAVEIVVEASPRRPLLSYIWGLPVLGLGDLLRDYREQAGRIEEFGRQVALRRTAGALVEMIAAAANPEPPPLDGVQ